MILQEHPYRAGNSALSTSRPCSVDVVECQCDGTAPTFVVAVDAAAIGQLSVDEQRTVAATTEERRLAACRWRSAKGTHHTA